MAAAPRPARMKGTLQTSRLAVPKGHSQHLGSGGVPIYRRIGKAARHRPPTRYATIFSLPHLQAGARGRAPCVLCKADADGAGVQAVALGESLFDMLANDFDVPREEVKSWTPKAGGAPLNVATALARLGVNSALVTVLGTDEMGDQLLKLLDERGVSLEGVQRRPDPTRDVYVTRTSKGERTFCGFGLPTMQYCDCFLETDTLPVYAIQDAQALIMGTLGLSSPTTGRTMRRAMEMAQSAGTLVLIDVNWRPVFFENPKSAKAVVEEFVRQADIVKLTDEEVEWMFGINVQNIFQEPCKVAELLPNAKGVLVTGGPKGAAYCFAAGDEHFSGFVPVYPVQVVDTTGAGDAFTAGFLFKLIQAGGLSALLRDAKMMYDAVRFASACGGITTTQPGAVEAQPELDQVQELISAVPIRQ